ncbi:MAG: trigger factor [Flavobacteriales bacterium]
MNISQENLDALNAVVKIELQPEDYKPQYETSLKRYRKQVTLPGFRAGQVPMALVKKQHGKSILAEEINGIIQQALSNYIQENRLRVLGNPLPKAGEDQGGDWDNPENFTFEFELGLAPEVNVKLDGKQKFEYFKVKVDEKLIERQMSDLAKRYGKMSEPEEAGENDLLVGTLIELEKKEIKPGGLMNDTTISLEHLEDKKTKTALIGAKIDNEITVKPSKLATSDADLAKLLNLPIAEAKKVKADFMFRVKEVKNIEPADLNEELFDKLFGPDVIKTEEEFKERTKADLEKMFNQDSEQVFRRKMVEKLIDSTDIQLPDAFLKRWITETSDKNLSPEELEVEYPNYKRSLSWQLIENSIAAEHKIQVTQEDAKAKAKELMAAQYAQYGLPLDDEQLDAFAAQALAKEEDSKYIYDSLVEERIGDAVKSNVKLVEKEMPYEEFLAWAQG